MLLWIKALLCSVILTYQSKNMLKMKKKTFSGCRDDNQFFFLLYSPT